MTKSVFQIAILKKFLKPSVGCDLPGRLRLCFRRQRALLEQALPYLHYVQEVLMMLDGVKKIEINPRIGTVLVLYDTERLSSKDILHWVDVIIDTGVRLAQEAEQLGITDERSLEAMMRKRLSHQLPQKKKG